MADLDLSLLEHETLERLMDQQVIGRPLTSLNDFDIDKLMGAIYKWVDDTNIELAAISGGGGGPMATTDLTDVGGPVNSPLGLVKLNSLGNLGLGTATPSAKLEVYGSLKVVDGTQGSGRVLFSDADGLASWQSLPAVPVPPIRVTYTGTLVTPLKIVPDFGTISIPAGTASGAVDYTVDPDSIAIRGLVYRESSSGVALGPGLESLTLDNVTAITGGTLRISDALELQSFSAPNLETITATGVESANILAGSVSFSNVPSLATLNLPSLKYLGVNLLEITNSMISSFSLPSLEVATAALYVPSSAATVSLNNLTLAESVNVQSNSNILSLNLPSLTAGGVGVSDCSSLSELNLPLLAKGFLYAASCPLISEVDLSLFVNGPIGIVALPSLTSVLLPVLQTSNQIQFDSNISLPALSFPSLQSGTISINGNAVLSLVLFPVLQTAYSLTINGNPSLAALSFPSLQQAISNNMFDGNTALVSLSFPAMQFWQGDSLIGNDNTILSSITIGIIGTLKKAPQIISFVNAALSQSTVDDMLALLVSLDGTNGTTLFTGSVYLSGGTSSSPSVAGLADKLILEGRGCFVSVN